MVWKRMKSMLILVENVFKIEKKKAFASGGRINVNSEILQKCKMKISILAGK